MRWSCWSIGAVIAGGMLAYAGPAHKSPESGEKIYKMRCGGCHGLDGKAQTTIGKNLKMRDLTSPEVQSQTDADLTRTIANGMGRMPSYQLILGPEGIQAVIGYIREMGKP